jgi:hypothetical protein
VTTLKNTILWSVPLWILILSIGTRAAEPLTSGPKVGDYLPGGLNALYVTGQDAGKTQCPV